MQPNFNTRNTSSLIRQTEATKKKAHRRLIGSIFLLLIALIVLLNVTARVKPIAVDPQIISIKGNTQNNEASAPIPAQTATTVNTPANNASGAIAVISSTSSVKVVSSTPINTTQASNPGFKAQVINAQNNTSVSSNTSDTTVTTHNESTNELPKFKAQVITETITNKPTPEDILNGNIDSQTSKRYYVQIFASKDRERLVKLQSMLGKRNIKTIIQSIQTPNGVIYRLRIGPFNSTTLANSQLNKINNAND